MNVPAGKAAGPYRVHQRYTRWTHKPRYIVIGPGGEALSHPATLRTGPRVRTWSKESSAQSVADYWNARATGAHA